MARELKSIDVSSAPDTLRIAEEVQASRTARVLRRDREVLAVLVPARRAVKAVRKRRPVGAADALLELVGIGKSGIVGGISGKKHDYLVRTKRSQ